MAYNGDGTLVVGSAADDRKVRVWYADSGRLAATVSHAGTGDTRFALSAEGRHLAVTNNMSTAVYQLSNSDVQSFVASSPGIDQIAVSSDLGRIAWDADPIDIWDRVDGRDVRRADQKIKRRSVRHMTMAADGSRLMARLDDSTVATWDVAAGTEIQHAEEPKLKLGAMVAHGKVFWAANLVDANRLLEGEALQPFSVDDRSRWVRPAS